MSNPFDNAGKRETVPFRYDIVGSFLRPENLKEARAKFEEGNLSYEELKKIEDIEIIKLVKKQQEIGLKAVTDGEFRRSWWHLDFMWGFDGVERTPLERGYIFHGEETRAETASLSGKIGFGKHPFLEHFKFLKSIAGEDVIARQTIPAPAQFLFELQRPENQENVKKYYSSEEELIGDIAKAYYDAIEAFYQLGCRNIQLDDCTWGVLVDNNFRENCENLGLIDPDDTAKQFLELNNLAIKGHPSDLVITTHVCRGNYHSTWASSGGYDPVAEVLFKEDVAGFYLEYDTDRSGDFEPLRYLGDKQVVLGLITSKSGTLEKKEDVIARIKEAAQYVDINQICLSPQCGFASTEEGNILTEEEQWNKLRLIKEIANEIWI